MCRAEHHRRQHGECRQVGDRVQRCEADDETKQAPRPQLRRAPQYVGIGPIERERELGRVEAQVLHQDLCRKHGQKGQEQPCAEHRDDVAKVGGQRDTQVGDDVAGTAAPDEDRVINRGEVLGGQDHIGALPRHVHGITRADAHVGGLQGGQVVDAVTKETGRAPCLP